MKPKLNELYIGEVYAENEVKFLEQFKSFYYDINSVSKRILDKRKYVVIGRKGTGKTLLANVICESLKEEYSITKVESLKEFVFHELTNFGGEDISSTKYIPIFEWMIYVNIAKNIVSNAEKFQDDRVDLIRRFLECFGFIGGDLRPEKTIELTLKSQSNVKGKLGIFDFGIGGKYQTEDIEKMSPRTYLENIENLKQYVLDTIKPSKTKIIIFYDELDDKFTDTDQYKHGIISFLSAIEKTNNLFFDNKIDSKICAVLRSDIINKLNAPNINRIFEDNAIFLNWEASRSRDTELFSMLAHKIKNSSSYYTNKDENSILSSILPDKIAEEHFKVYILHRTLGRPRDIIRMLKYIQDEFGANLDRFEGITFKKTEKKYSSYLKREIKSELSGHVDDTTLDNFFNFLSQIGKRSFTYESAKGKINDAGFIKNESELRVMLNYLFKAGAICNVVRRSKEEGGNIYYWSYHDEDFSVNYGFQFEIHPGLWDTLKIPKPKYRFN